MSGPHSMSHLATTTDTTAQKGSGTTVKGLFQTPAPKQGVGMNKRKIQEAGADKEGEDTGTPIEKELVAKKKKGKKRPKKGDKEDKEDKEKEIEEEGTNEGDQAKQLATMLALLTGLQEETRLQREEIRALREERRGQEEEEEERGMEIDVSVGEDGEELGTGKTAMLVEKPNTTPKGTPTKPNIRKEEGGTPAKTGTRRTRGISLPRMKDDIIMEAAMRRFVQKVQEKINGGEELNAICMDMSSALMNGAYDSYQGYLQEYDGKITSTEQLKQLLEKMLAGVTVKKGITAKRTELEAGGQKEKETIKGWGSRVRTELKVLNAAEYTMTETFVKGIRDTRVRAKMRARMAVEEMTLTEAMEAASQQQIYYRSKEETTTTKKRVTFESTNQEDTVIAPIFQVKLSDETCRNIIEKGGGEGRDREVYLEERTGYQASFQVGKRVEVMNAGGVGERGIERSSVITPSCATCASGRDISQQNTARRHVECVVEWDTRMQYVGIYTQNRGMGAEVEVEAVTAQEDLEEETDSVEGETGGEMGTTDIGTMTEEMTDSEIWVMEIEDVEAIEEEGEGKGEEEDIMGVEVEAMDRWVEVDEEQAPMI